MKFRYALVALAMACTGDVIKDSGDSTVNTTDCGPMPQVAITGADVTCTGNTVRFTMETTGLTSDGAVFTQETASQYAGGQWSDNHTLVSYDFDACGDYDKLEREIQDGDTLDDPINDWAINQSSVFQCDAHYNDEGFMTYAFAAFDQQGNLADCLAFGDDPQGLINGNYDDERVGDDPDFPLSACRPGTEGL